MNVTDSVPPLSLVKGATTTPLSELTIGQLLQQAVDFCPETTALISMTQGLSLTYRQLDAQSLQLARRFVELGLESGDRIGIWSPNNIEWIVTMYAAARLGLIIVNVNPAYRVSELEYALTKVGCKALVMADSFKTSDYPAMLEEIAPQISQGDGARHRLAELAQLQTTILISAAPRAGYLNFDEVVKQGKHSTTDISAIEAQQYAHAPINIQFTSGTTGTPKGAMLTHHNIVNNGMFTGLGIELVQGDVLCAPVPLYHCFGMVMAVLACASHKATLVLPSPVFEPCVTLQAVQQYHCTALYGVPTMFSAMLEQPDFADYDLTSLRTGIVAGSLCGEVLMQRIVNDMSMSKVTNCYGMTETSPVSFQGMVDASMDKRTTTVGKVHPHVQAKLIDPQGNIVPRGVTGEICTRGYSTMHGYWEDDERTQEAIVDGWMHSGDQGVFDDEGYCSIVGRIKDTIIRGGENIAPKEVEDFLLRHPSVAQAQVFGVSDAKYGEAVAAWLQLKAGEAVTAQEIQGFCQNSIAHFKIPAYVRVVDEFPLTVTGKIQKFKMREIMEAQLGLKS